LRIKGHVAGISVIQRLTLYRGIKKIDLDNTIDWKPGRSMNLQQIFPVSRPNVEIRNGIPFGTAAAADMMVNAGPHWEDEVSPDLWKEWRQIQDWVFVGDQEWGFTVSADHNLVEVSGAAVKADMIRGTRFSPATTVQNGQQILDARPPAGTYVFRYSFTSGKGDWYIGKSWRTGMAFSTPLIPVSSVNAGSEKPLPPEESFFSLTADNIVLTAMKKADADGAIVVRTFEIQGKPAESSLVFLGQERSYRQANMLEDDLPAEQQQTLHMKPYEIDTLKLQVH
jgi:alpha-mannosidase